MKIKKGSIFFKKDAYQILNFYLNHHIDDRSNLFILVDNITEKYCIPILFHSIDLLKRSHIIRIQTGEKEKNIHTCIQICNQLERWKANRKSLILNLGGGVITDIGGFVSSIFKRGIRFINIPTTLLGMVDASIGGKTGVNLNTVKNEIGSFYSPEFLIIDINFLQTLSNEEILSGMAEMLKHGLISDRSFWIKMKNLFYIEKIHEKNVITNKKKWESLISQSILIKKNIVDHDPQEKGLRKILNFGHTIGHALESYFIMNNQKITHGKAIAMGMICESFISNKINGLSMQDYKEINFIFSKLYSLEKNQICEREIDHLFPIMENDKKNENNQILFSLLKRIGECLYNCPVSYSLIKKSFMY
ncbi:3-dehydroquinate synthase [Blattabacterium cuenoti]|nr:3-dehydroquinate synthase [Blattabacterium cuenoti]